MLVGTSLPGVSVSDAIQSDQRPDHSSGHDSPQKPWPDNRKHHQDTRGNYSTTHPSCGLLEGEL